MKHAIWFVLTLVLIGAIVFLAYGIVRQGRRGEQTAPETKPLEGLIVTAEPVMRTFRQQVPWTGVVQSASTVELIALTAGRVEAIQVTDGAPVRVGTTVMTLGGPLLAARQEKLQADVKSLQAQLALAEQNVKAIQQNVAQELATRSDLATAQTEQLKLEAQLRGAQADLDTFSIQTQVVAPISGAFTKRQVSVGQAIKEGDVLGAIVDPNHLRILAALFVPDRTTLEGREAVVQLGAGRTLPATVRSVLPQATATGAVQVWIEGSQIDEQMRPGQTTAGTVTVEIRTSPAVPESAVVYDPQEQPYVFVLEQGRYERRGIRIGMTQDGWVEILSGLQPGETVVTKGAYELLHREFTSQYRVED